MWSMPYNSWYYSKMSSICLYIPWLPNIFLLGTRFRWFYLLFGYTCRRASNTILLWRNLWIWKKKVFNFPQVMNTWSLISGCHLFSVWQVSAIAADCRVPTCLQQIQFILTEGITISASKMYCTHALEHMYNQKYKFLE